MNIIKKTAYGFAAYIMVMPFVAGAQLSTPSGTNLPTGTVVGILTSGMNWLLVIVGIMGVIGFVIAGLIYLTAAGDDEQIKKGKKAMVYALVGVIVALVGVVILQAVKSLLNAEQTF